MRMQPGLYFVGTLTGFKREEWRNGNGVTHKLILSREWEDEFGRKQFSDFVVNYNPDKAASAPKLQGMVGKEIVVPVGASNRKFGDKSWVEYYLPTDADVYVNPAPVARAS